MKEERGFANAALVIEEADCDRHVFPSSYPLQSDYTKLGIA